eukprot:6064216-Pleurochrysis_carterae.AAC.1
MLGLFPSHQAARSDTPSNFAHFGAAAALRVSVVPYATGCAFASFRFLQAWEKVKRLRETCERQVRDALHTERAATAACCG